LKLKEVGLKVEKSTKFHPVIIIYDVEKNLQVKEMTDELINKNLNNVDKKYLSKIRDEIKFIRSYEVKEEN